MTDYYVHHRRFFIDSDSRIIPCLFYTATTAIVCDSECMHDGLSDMRSSRGNRSILLNADLFTQLQLCWNSLFSVLGMSVCIAVLLSLNNSIITISTSLIYLKGDLLSAGDGSDHALRPVND